MELAGDVIIYVDRTKTDKNVVTNKGTNILEDHTAKDAVGYSYCYICKLGGNIIRGITSASSQKHMVMCKHDKH